RWRDALRPFAQGLIQVRGGGSWLPLARFRQRPILAAEGPRPLSRREELLTRQAAALDEGNPGAIRAAVEECRAYLASPGRSDAARELLTPAVGQAILALALAADDLCQVRRHLGDLAKRDDLPEAVMLAETVALRLDEGDDLQRTEGI